MSEGYLLGIDQGTSGSKAVILDGAGDVRGLGYVPLARHYPRPGWVEQDPRAVAAGVAQAIALALKQAGIGPDALLACGLTSQRNTIFAWDRVTGEPIGSVMTWQDLRVAPLLAEVGSELMAEARYRLGYAPGLYMGALHLGWRRRHDAAYQAAVANGRLQVGLATAWLLRTLGTAAGHQMDSSLVQAMGVYDFRAGEYWSAWLALWGIPRTALPTVVPTVTSFGSLRVRDGSGREAEVPVLAMLGDQQAAMFGHGARQAGMAACTHGTASYVKVCMGAAVPAQTKINTYHAWQVGGQATYCLEAPTMATGAAARWLQENLKLFADYEMMSQLVAGVADSGGVCFVPAFTGMEMPETDTKVRAMILGLTLGHERGHLIRAFFEAIGYQMRGILALIAEETGVMTATLSVGGGVSASDLACQIQADIVGIPIVRPAFRETTAWAAAVLAGLGAGVWPAMAAVPLLPGGETTFMPQTVAGAVGYERWQAAVALARQWV